MMLAKQYWSQVSNFVVAVVVVVVSLVIWQSFSSFRENICPVIVLTRHENNIYSNIYSDMSFRKKKLQITE